MIDDQVRHDRIDVVRNRLMAERGLDMLLAYSDDPLEAGAVRYLTDFDVYAMYAIVVVPRRGDVALAFGMHHSAYLIRAKETSRADYYLGTYQPGDLCRQLLLDCGTGGKAKIGLVGGTGMFSRIEADLRRSLPDATFSDVDANFWALCAGHSTQSQSDVLARLRRSAAICAESLEGGGRRWQASRSACEIAADIGLAARRRGADILNREMVRVALATGVPLPRHLSREPSSLQRPSDALAIEVRTSYRGLHAAAARTFCSNTGFDDDIKIIHDQHRSLCSLFKTGTKVGVILDAARHNGGTAIAAMQPVELGSGIGFSARQEPILRPGSDTLLPAMSAFVCNTVRAHPHLGTVRFADTVLVTNGEGEILTDKTYDRART